MCIIIIINLELGDANIIIIMPHSCRELSPTFLLASFLQKGIFCFRWNAE